MGIDEGFSDQTSGLFSIYEQSTSNGENTGLNNDKFTLSSEIIAYTNAHELGQGGSRYRSPDSGIQEDDYDHSFKIQAPMCFVPDQPIRCLQDELYAALMPTHQEWRGFFAKGQLALILTEERVRNELAIHFEDSLAEDTIAKHARTICQETVIPDEDFSRTGQVKTRSYIKILAILIMAQKTRAIVKLLEDPESVNDSDLPLVRVPRPNNARLFDLRIGARPKTVLKCFQTNWNQLNIRNFEELQWATLPLEFAKPSKTRTIAHHVLNEKEILPFFKDSREPRPHFSHRRALEGGFASVFKVAIHPKHQSFHTAPDNPDTAFNFAVKGLHSQNREVFDKEVEILRKFSNNRHNHLISLLATYEQAGRFYLLFDWAEADLQKYWRIVNPSPSFDVRTLLWLARQCKGIAHGITKIHEHRTTCRKPHPHQAGPNDAVFGHHGDIKPENVLWFAEPGRENITIAGTLKLSDFGLAEFSIHETFSMTPKEKLGVSLGYRAPETDLQQGAAIGRSYDMWTLGCLYLEFITWMLGGSKLLDEFMRQRKARDAMWHDIETHTFFALKIEDREKKAVIKPSVTRFIQRLHAHQKCSQFLHDFLVMVEDDLLVVKKNDKQQIDRISIQQAHQELVCMLGKCEKDPRYAVEPVPGPREEGRGK